MTVMIERIRPEHVEGYHHVEDIVSRERKYLSYLDAGPVAEYHDFVPKGIAKGHPRFVAVDGVTVIGWCQIIPNSIPVHAHNGYLGMGLLPEYRGRGIGRALIETTLAEACRIGLARIGLSAFADNTRAIALYEGAGFKREGQLRDFALIDGKYTDFIMISLVFRLDDKSQP